MDELTIGELEVASGVPRRTIYFYVQQGILPPPTGAGLAARYHKLHLFRLRAVPRLRSLGCRLDDIREFFRQHSEDEVAALDNGDAADRSSRRVDRFPCDNDVFDRIDGLRRLDEKVSQLSNSDLPGTSGGASTRSRTRPVRDTEGAMPVGWQQAIPQVRYALAPGVDLVVERDQSPAVGERVARLLAVAARLFGHPGNPPASPLNGKDSRSDDPPGPSSRSGEE